jgi:hypothetical protein
MQSTQEQSTHGQRTAAHEAPALASLGLTLLSRVTRGRSTAVSDASWVDLVRLAALVVFPGLIVVGVVRPGLAGRLLWTVAVASLPLLFVIAGYHRWRRICPLAFIAQLPVMLGVAGQRRAGPWLRAHGYRLAFGLFLVSLWLRLIATNGDGYAIAICLSAISLAAFGTGLIFTGKTWCSYVCPVSFVEKLYTEPRGLRDTPNSQCQKCTACRPTCPDINQENSYWKEILLPDKRHVFFAFPGVVLAFYVYYYLQAGTWEYYFGGRWTNEVGLFRTAFLAGTDAATAGLYFWPRVPRALATAATLALGSGVSLALFSLAERPIGALLRRHDAATDESSLRHAMFSLAAFAAFVTFYSFAGAPTLMLVPGAAHLFQLVVVTTGTLFLVRRMRRRSRDFSEETLARKIIAKWPWSDAPPPRDLREAFLIHTVRSQSEGNARAGVIDLYKEAVRESVNSGVMSRADVHRLESLRSQLCIAEADHERVMSELVDEDRGLIKRGLAQASPEKQLQLETYAEEIAGYLDGQSATGGAVDDAVIRRLRAEYGVTADEHRAVLDHLVQSREGIAAHMLDAPASIEEAAAAIRSIEPLRSSVNLFLLRLLRRRWIRTVEGLLHVVDGGDERTQTLREGLLSSDAAQRETAIRDLGSRLSPATAARLRDALERASRELGAPLDPSASLRIQLSSPDPYVRATVIYILESNEVATDADRQVLANDEHPLVRETLANARAVAAGETVAEPSTLEKMIALRSVSIFDALEPEDLVGLARAGAQAWFMQGDMLCREGEIGEEAFVLLAGEVTVLRRDGDTDRVVAVEEAGSCIGELSVLDSAPRESTVVASSVAVRVLRLNGRTFREALSASPAVSEGIIRLLAQRLRAVAVSPTSPDSRR